MLGKLLKYEIKATSRTFMPLYGALLLVSLVSNLLSYSLSDFNLGFGITFTLLIGLFVALGVMTLVVLIQRFNVNLLGDEGYLMFTLPVKAHQLILSKLITTIFWSFLSCIVSILTFILLVDGLNFSFFKELFTVLLTEFTSISETLSKVMQHELFRQTITLILLVLALGLSTYIGIILEIYLALSIGQFPIFCKHRNIASIVAFFVINSVLQFITPILMLLAGNFFPLGLSFFYNPILWLSLYLTFVIMVDVLFFFTIQTILNKHLNLE